MSLKLMVFGLLCLILGGANASVGSLVLPKSYTAVLNCPASYEAPNFMVAKRKNDFFLAVKINGKVKLVKLHEADGDMGYTTYSPDNRTELGHASKFASWIYIENDEADVDDMSKALITGGVIRSQGRERDQKCIVLGKFKAQ